MHSWHNLCRASRFNTTCPLTPDLYQIVLQIVAVDQPRHELSKEEKLAFIQQVFGKYRGEPSLTQALLEERAVETRFGGRTHKKDKGAAPLLRPHPLSWPADYLALTAMRLGLASSILGKTSRSTPLSNLASALLASTVEGRMIVRWKGP